MILITGASGRLGRLVINELLQRGYPADHVVAAVRRPDVVADLAERGVQVRHADYDEPSTWPSALEGVSTVLLIATSDAEARLRHHATVIDAAGAAPSATRLAYGSLLHLETSTYVHADSERTLEERIRNTGLRHAMLRFGWFTENYAELIRFALEDGILRGAASDGLISDAAREDFAAAAAIVLIDDDLDGVHELAGDSGFTLSDVAAMMTRHSGVEIRYENLSEAEFDEWMISAGYPASVASSLSSADVAASRGQVHDGSRQLSTLIGRPTTPLATSITRALAQARG